MIILVCSSSGCILDPFQENYLSISYWAEYDEKVDIKSVETIFTQNNITCKLNEYNDLSFSFSKRQIDNETIESTIGTVWTDTWRYQGKYETDLDVRLDPEVYPNIKKGEDKEKLYSYKPYLNKSMDYVTMLIYNATGLWPVMKEYTIGDDTK